MKTNMHLKTVVIFTALCAVMSAFAPMPGAHSFQVYLDDKIVADQYMKASHIAPKIIIDPAENHKQLVLKYSECGRTVSGRVISIKDNNDKLLKEWKFDGTTKAFEDPMTFNIKDLVALKQKSSNTLKLYYASADFPGGQHVVTLVLGPGTNTAAN